MKLLLVLLCLPALFGFKFSPMSTSIELGDDQKNAQFFVENETDESVAIELTVKERVMDENGKEELPASGEISIFPPQVIIPAKEKRTIRVSWSGGKNLDVEKSFRVIAEQLPLDVNQKVKKKSGIQMLLRYMAALYVRPKDAEAKLKASFTRNGKALDVTVENDGSEHKVLTKPLLQFRQSDQKWTLKDDELKGLTGENVLAKKKRIFHLNTSQEIPAGAEVILKVND